MSKEAKEHIIGHCATCCYFSETKDGSGECRRRAPTRIVDNQRGTEQLWPTTFDEYWCGEYRSLDAMAGSVVNADEGSESVSSGILEIAEKLNYIADVIDEAFPENKNGVRELRIGGWVDTSQ